MEQLSLFDDRKFEYLVVIPPSQEIMLDVKTFKKTFYDFINSQAINRYAKAHITLLDLFNSTYSEEEIILKLKKVVSTIHKMNIKVEGIEKFNHGRGKRSIILSISNEKEIQELFKKLAHEFYLKMKNITPHITLAKNITIEETEALEEVISTISYMKEFQADRLSVLKREIIDGKPQAYFLVSDIMLN